MKKIKRSVVFICLFQLFILNAQNIGGSAMYVVKKKLNMKLDTTKYNLETRQKLSNFFTSQFVNEFELIFNEKESVYKKQEKLEVGRTSIGSSDILYKNYIDGTYMHQREFLGKMFLIKDSLPSYQWNLVGESKQIGSFTCFKAELREGNTGEVLVEAWYAPKISISAGPMMYSGLPGLILEVNDSNYSLLCTSIVLNQKSKKSQIKVPKRGKVINQSQFNAIEQEKLKTDKGRIRGFMNGIESSRQKVNKLP